MPKISVIVPMYNMEKYIEECLDSILQQTLSDLEIIIINDGSTDSSLNIIREYQKKDRIYDKGSSCFQDTPSPFFRSR